MTSTGVCLGSASSPRKNLAHMNQRRDGFGCELGFSIFCFLFLRFPYFVSVCRFGEFWFYLMDFFLVCYNFLAYLDATLTFHSVACAYDIVCKFDQQKMSERGFLELSYRKVVLTADN